MSNTRELSQLASVISVADETTNVGIGTTNPTSKLTVSGDIKVTGVVTATTFTGSLTGIASSTTNIPNLTGAITSNNTTTSLGSFTSANLASALTDETGSGAAVFATSPTLVTPVLGIATATSLNVSGIVTATSFVGNGSGLTGVSAGIGTTGSINTSGIITATSVVVSAGTTALPSISPTGDSNTGIFFPAADTIAASTGGAERVRITAAGLVGIGTNPSKDLHVYKSSGTTTLWLESGDAQKPIAAISIDNNTYAFQSTYNTGGTSARPFVWYNVSTELMRLDTSGRLLVGTATSNANGGVLQLSGGITFPATQVAATDANTLDDYEEGDWTPVFKFGGANVSMTGTFAGKYVKVGKVVYYSASIVLSAKGSSIGTTTIEGLPFANASGNVSYSTTIGFLYNGASLTGPIMPRVEVSATRIDVFQNSAAGYATVSQANFNNDSQLQIFGFYFI